LTRWRWEKSYAIDDQKHGLSFVCKARVCKHNDLTWLMLELIFSYFLAWSRFERLQHAQYIYRGTARHLMHLIINSWPQC
jgi:hypothetical protein